VTVIEVIPELVHTLSKTWLRRGDFLDGPASPTFDPSKWADFSHISDDVSVSNSHVPISMEPPDMERYRSYSRNTPYWTPQRSLEGSPRSSFCLSVSTLHSENFDMQGQDLYEYAPRLQRAMFEHMLAPENNSLTSQLASLISAKQTLALDSRPTVGVAHRSMPHLAKTFHYPKRRSTTVCRRVISSVLE
jgi:hypothetical protein